MSIGTNLPQPLQSTTTSSANDVAAREAGKGKQEAGSS